MSPFATDYLESTPDPTLDLGPTLIQSVVMIIPTCSTVLLQVDPAFKF